MNHSNQKKQTSNKKAYERPVLKGIGSISNITQGPSGGAIDGIFGAPGGFQQTPPGS